VKNRQIGLPGTDCVAILLGHHPRDLLQVPQVMSDPCRQELRLARRTLEPVERMAICVRVGLPEDAHLVTAKIGRYLAASGDVLAGPSREVFLQPPNPERMHESVVEMQFAIRPRDTTNPEAAST